ncbi:unnamed protein product [Symbiodinium sp. CCMP2592]|nr:unnamed protein product [Symbiodinium sp. CCMP2592]
MVVKYTMEDQVVKRESKFEHALPKALRDTVPEVAEKTGTAAASLVAWSLGNPDAPDSSIPRLSQVSRKKARARESESSIEDVKELVAHLKRRPITKEWQFEILAEDLTQGFVFFSPNFSSSTWRASHSTVYD